MLDYSPLNFTIERFASPSPEKFLELDSNNIFKPDIDNIVKLLNNYLNTIVNAAWDGMTSKYKGDYNSMVTEFNEKIDTIDVSDDDLNLTNIENTKDYLKDFIVKGEYYKFIKTHLKNEKTTINIIKYDDYVKKIENLLVQSVSETIGVSTEFNVELTAVQTEINKYKSITSYTNQVITQIRWNILMNSFNDDVLTELNNEFSDVTTDNITDGIDNLEKLKDKFKTLHTTFNESDKLQYTINKFNKVIDDNIASIKIGIDCIKGSVKDNVIPGSAWYWYKKSEKGGINSKWIIKDNLQFSQLSNITENKPLFDDFTKANIKLDDSNWKANPFTKYITKVKINMFVLVLLIIILIVLFVKFKYGNVRYVQRGLGFIIVIQILKVNNLMRGKGILNTTNINKLNITSEPSDKSLLSNIKTHINTTADADAAATAISDYNKFVDKLKVFPNSAFNKLFFYEVTPNDITKFKPEDFIKLITYKYNTRNGLISMFVLSIIIVPLCLSNFSNKSFKTLFCIHLCCFIIMIILYSSLSINKKLPTILQPKIKDLNDDNSINKISFC